MFRFFILCFLTIFSLEPIIMFGQGKTFFDRSWNPITASRDRKKAKYVRYVDPVKGGLYLQTDYTADRNKSLISKKYFIDKSLAVPQGLHQTFYRSGRIRSSGTYQNGKQNGVWEYFWPTGRPRLKGHFREGFKNEEWSYYDKKGNLYKVENYEMGLLHGPYQEYWAEDQLRMECTYEKGRLSGERKSYFESGDVARIERHESGRILEKQCFTPLGEDTTFYRYHIEAKFPGCENERPNEILRRKCSQDKLLDFLAANLEYPPDALANNKQGIVLMQFVVDKEGKIDDPLILEDISEDIAYECSRLFYKMPDWVPAQKDGRTTESLVEITIVFKPF